MVDAVERAAIDSILQYCGFDSANHRDLINDDGLKSYEDMLSLAEKDIGALAKGFTERTVAQGRIVFGLRRTNRLKAAINWAQDFRRVSREVTLDPAVTDMAEFRIQIETAKQRALIYSLQQRTKNLSYPSQAVVRYLGSPHERLQKPNYNRALISHCRPTTNGIPRTFASQKHHVLRRRKFRE
jgi:hypothetical protein